METLNKYRKETESNMPSVLKYPKKVKYQITHGRFVVPWQMDREKQEKDRTR